MTVLRRASRRGFIAAAGLMLASAGTAAAQDLPSADAIVERYREAIGAAAYAQKQSMHTVGEFSLPAMGLTASIESFAARPNRSAAIVPIPGFGEFRRGHTGEHPWSVDPMEGARVLQGAEAQEANDEGYFDAMLRPAALVESMTTVERTTIAGRDCYKVKVVWKSGRENTDCYSPESGLLVASVRTQQSSMGEVEAVQLYDDYKAFSGVTLPTRMTVQIMGNEQVITVRDVTFDDVPDSAFTPPAEIRALIGG
jgi:hypothetical protein